MRRFVKTIFGAIECCNIVATLFPRVTTLSQHYNPYAVLLKIIVANRPMQHHLKSAGISKITCD